MLHIHQIGRPVAIVVEHIGGKEPTLEQGLAAVDVADPWPGGLIPPSDIGVEMRAGEKFVTGLPVLRPGGGHAMKSDPIDAFAKGDVSDRLQ